MPQEGQMLSGGYPKNGQALRTPAFSRGWLAAKQVAPQHGLVLFKVGFRQFRLQEDLGLVKPHTLKISQTSVFTFFCLRFGVRG